MNAFCTAEECLEWGLEKIQFVYCCKTGYSKNKFIEGAVLFYVEKNSERFIESITSIVLPDNKTIILVDCGEDYDLSSKTFWGLRASGFSNTKILVLGDEMRLPISNGEITLAKKNEHAYLPFNNSVVLTKTDLENTSSFYQQLIHIETCGFQVGNSFLQKSEIVDYFKENGIKFSQSRSSIIFGKKACYGGILVNYVTGKTVSVVIDKIEKNPLPDRRPEESKSVLSSGYSVTINEHFEPTPVKPKEPLQRDSAVCANCLVF